jgi:hypothetical protein
MPSSMICLVMLTMWAWRILRRLTTSVICMREPQLVGLRLHGEDAHLAGFQIVEHRPRHVASGRGATSSSVQAR